MYKIDRMVRRGVGSKNCSLRNYYFNFPTITLVPLIQSKLAYKIRNMNHVAFKLKLQYT